MPTRLIALALAALLCGCGPEPDDDLFPAADELGFVHQAATCPSGGKVEPKTPAFGASIDPYASYVGQSTCDPSAKPGVKAFRDLVLATYPCTTSGGIVRACNIGGTSEHKEGRAWDWMIQVGHPAADALLGWLLKTDAHGNPHAMARRLGIMYIIWNKQMWRSYKASAGWLPYTGSNPHTDHVHFSFSWAGANKQTTFWTAAQSCKPKCDGTKIIGADCGVGDCGVYGSICVDDSLGVRCVFSMCPAQGKQTICVNETTLGQCDDGALSQTDCSATGERCVSAGDTASCGAPAPDLGPEPDAAIPPPAVDGGIGAPDWSLPLPRGVGSRPEELVGGCAVGRGSGAPPSALLPLLPLLPLVMRRRRWPGSPSCRPRVRPRSTR